MYAVIMTIVGFIVFLCVLFAIKTIIVIPNKEGKILDFIQEKHYKEAEFIIHQALKEEPHNTKMLFWLAEIFWLTDRQENAISIYEDLKNLKFNKQSHIYHIILFRLGSWYKDIRNLDYAYHIVEQLLAISQDHSEYYQLMGEILLLQNNPNQALLYFQQGLELNQKDISLWNILAYTHYNLSHYTEAFNAYSHMINLDASNPATWFRLGELSELLNNPQKAIKFYEKAEKLSHSSLSFDIVFKLGLLLLNLNERENGIIVLERARTLLKKYADSIDKSKILTLHYQLAEFYLKEQQIDLAIQEWENIITIDPHYLDVAEKLNTHSVSQLNDFFKDMLTLNDNRLVQALCDFVKSLGFTVDSYYVNGEAIDIIASDISSKWREINRRKVLFIFWCSDFELPNIIINKAQEHLNTSTISKVFIVSAGPIFSETKALLTKKSIHFFDRNNIQDLINVSKTFKLTINEQIQKTQKTPKIDN